MVGVAVFQFALSLRAQESPALTPEVRDQVIGKLSETLTRNYVYPDKAAAMNQFIQKKQLEKGYDNANDPQKFANDLTKDLRSVQQDTHLSVRYDPDLEKKVNAFEATAQKDSSDLEKERSQNFFFRKAEILRGNIGYINLTNFAEANDLSRKTAQAAFQFVANTDALILDLRNNFGGRNEMAKEVADYFFAKPQLAGKSFNRITDGWTDDWVGKRSEIGEGLRLTMPLYLLTSERTFSAAEGLAYNLKYLRNAVTVGVKTRGGAHQTRSFALGNGFVGFIPFTRSENVVTKTDWEGTGVEPNIPIKEEQALLKAQELILKNKLSAISDAVEKRKLEWVLNDLSSKMAKIDVPEEKLKTYVGTFEEFVFTLENGKLYCRNTHQKDQKDALVAINDHLFKIDEQSQVEFIADKDGVVKSIRMLWDDGAVDAIDAKE